MSGLDSMILQALERSREGKDLIWRAVRTGCQENPIPPTLTTACGWARRASATRTCAWPSTATSASTSRKVGSACPAGTEAGLVSPHWHCHGKRGTHGKAHPGHHHEINVTCRNIPKPNFQKADFSPKGRVWLIPVFAMRRRERSKVLRQSTGNSFCLLFEQSLLLPGSEAVVLPWWPSVLHCVIWEMLGWLKR